MMPEDQDLYPPHRPRSRSSSGEDSYREEAWAMWQRECQHEPWYQAWEKMTSDNEKERLAHQWNTLPGRHQQQQEQDHSQVGPQRRSRRRRRIRNRPLSPDITTEEDVILGPCWRCGSRQHLRAYCPRAATTSSPTRRATGLPTTARPAATTHFAQPAAATFLVQQYLSEAAALQIPATPEMTPASTPEPPPVPAEQRTRWA